MVLGRAVLTGPRPQCCFQQSVRFRHFFVNRRGADQAWSSAGRGVRHAKDNETGPDGYPVKRVHAQKTNRRVDFVPKFAKLNIKTSWMFKDRYPVSRLKWMARPQQPWSFSEEEYMKLKKIYVKPPLSERPLTEKQQMLELREEEVQKINAKFPREIQKFKAGDRIAITKYLDLADPTKFEVLKGYCLGRRNNNLESHFTIINNKLDSTWEMKLPLWSPFIKKVVVLQKGKVKTNKAYYMRDRPVEEFQT